MNRTVPNLSNTANLAAWSSLEQAKKSLIYSLIRFKFALFDKSSHPQLQFDFLADGVIGHENGVITINIKEADDVERERQRQFFSEPYRTLLGHLRHESGHYFWMMLIQNSPQLDAFRAIFGDEQTDYAIALERHHASGPALDWRNSHVSGYASSHPWEDWAETWAHYLHMVDAVDTADAVGMEPRAAGFAAGTIWPFEVYDVYTAETFDAILERWLPLTVALNSMSRSMGHVDFYPFVLTASVIKKLGFVHSVIRQYQSSLNVPQRP